MSELLRACALCHVLLRALFEMEERDGRTERSGAERSGTDWNGTGMKSGADWNGTGRKSGAAWNGTGRDGTGRDATGRDATGRDAKRRTGRSGGTERVRARSVSTRPYPPSARFRILRAPWHEVARPSPATREVASGRVSERNKINPCQTYIRRPGHDRRTGRGIWAA
jgi:hypothetical protein